MKEFLIDILKTNLAPLAFLIIASMLCLLLPEAKIVEAVYLVIGAALTRVKKN